MEQAWTVDKYDIPRGDLEFWATRRGILKQSANRNAASVDWSGTIPLGRAALIAGLSFVTGMALQACLWIG